jgi:hypothetical protein
MRQTAVLLVLLAGIALAAPPLRAEPRPQIFGCGMIWGNWLQLPFEDAKEWDRRSMDKIVQMGGTNCPANFAWIDIERTRGARNWDYVDHQVDEALARGLEIFAYTGLTPDWALPPEAPDISGIGYRFPPDPQYIPDFESFFTELAARYRGRVKYYEFWNEPNGCSWINDGCANGHMAYTYVPWLIRWYDAMKAGDPDCVLAVGGLDYHSGVTFGYQYVEDIYTYGGGDYFDAVAIHPYGEPLHWKAIHDTYQVLVNHGDGHKKLWLNEYGWNTDDEARKAANLTTVLNALKQPEYHMVFQANYLVITDLPDTPDWGHDYGLCSRNTSTLEIFPRQSWYAFRDMDKTFPDDPTPSATFTPGPSPTPTSTYTPGPSPTPTETRTPTPTRTPDPSGNILLNPKFEESFDLAPPWFQDDPAYPRYHARAWSFIGSNWWNDSGLDADVFYSPSHSQAVGTDWRSLDNTIYQVVQVSPDTDLRFSAWTRVDCPLSGTGHLRRRIAVDPTGGTLPTGPNVIHGEWNWTEETWEHAEIVFTPQDFRVTVFMQVETVETYSWQWFYVDDAFLGPAEETTTPTPTETVTPTPADVNLRIY